MKQEIILIYSTGRVASTFNINVYYVLFNNQLGYQIYENATKNIKVLLRKFEDLVKCQRREFTKFLNIKNGILKKKK